MKLLLSWIGTHITAWRQPPIQEIVARFNATVAEIEQWYPLERNLDQWMVVHIAEIQNGITVTIPSQDSRVELPHRPDVAVGDFLLAIQDTASMHWATMRDAGSVKDHLLPPIFITAQDAKTENWKKQISTLDYVLDIENKSITQRPDLWSHRGVARELAALFDGKLVAGEQASKKIIIIEEKNRSSSSAATETVSIKDDRCLQLAALELASAPPHPSIISVLFMLSALDIRPINAWVDLTNLVMVDSGHPMHAFDAESFVQSPVIVRAADAQERLELLDGETITLTPHDLVVANNTQALSLAGIMGGKKSGVSGKTKSIVLEAALFDAVTIRLSATHHKKRTESSARFEKSLDSYGPRQAIERYLFFLDTYKIPYTCTQPLVVSGVIPVAPTIAVSQAFIEGRLGKELSSEQIIKILTERAFVVKKRTVAQDIVYDITVPSFRATKDVTMPEDIVEEVGRCIGYDNIPLQLPRIPLVSHPARVVQRMRAIKQVLSYGLAMREIQPYTFFDEQWLQACHWQPGNAVRVEKAVSANWQSLVTSYVPSLLKAVADNVTHHDQLRFFNEGPVWKLVEEQVQESLVISIMCYDKTGAHNFYSGKALVEQLMGAVGLDISWQSVANPADPWFVPYKTAYLVYEGTVIGTAGMMTPQWSSYGADAGSIFVCVCDSAVLSAMPQLPTFMPLPKYPVVYRDVSVYMPIAQTAAQVMALIGDCDDRITQVQLIDFFEKDEWKEYRSLTLRVTIVDREKTLLGSDVDTIMETIIMALKAQGGTIR